MINKQLLPYISNNDLYDHVREVLDIGSAAVHDIEKKLNSNIIDPFSALFDALRQNISLSEWLEQEKSRQIQKTLQNAVGEFHPKIIGSIQGWEWLRTGGIIDVKNTSKRIICEMKNKYNTTKGNHRAAIYDELKSQLDSTYVGYTGFYVEIIPSTKNPYNKPYVPSDNLTHTRRPENKYIRVIDGRSFYALASGIEEALPMLYQVLPSVIADILKVSPKIVTDDKLFPALFASAY